MSAAELITRISELGGRLYLDAGDLRLKAPKGVLTDELRAELQAKKQDLIDFLSAAQSAEGKTRAEITPANRNAPLPASFSQQRLWFLEQLEPGKPVYNMPFSMRIRGALNKAALQGAFDDLVARHESLRTRFESDGEAPLQVIDPSLRTVVSVEQNHGAAQTAIDNWVSECAARPFDLHQGPLLRAHLLETGEQDFQLVIVMHHIVSDAWSMSILLQELAALYEARSLSKPAELPELSIQYADFAAWQRNWLQGPELERQAAYWRNKLGDAPPLLELPTDRPRPAVQSYVGDHLAIKADAELTRKLRGTSQAMGVSMFMLLQAAFNVLLARYTGTDDIVVGTPIAGRQQGELEPLIGLFLNTLVLRNDLSGNPRFAELVDRVRKTTLAAYDHQDLPFEKLVDELRPERQLSYAPVFQVMFNLRAQGGGSVGLPGLTTEFGDIERHTTMFDLSLSVDEARDSLSLEFEYATDLFERDSINRIATHYLTLLESIVARPECRIFDLPMLDEVERKRLLVDWNDTAFDYPTNLTVHAMVEQQVRRQPQAIALRAGATELTYAELNRRANKLAETLTAAGAGPGSLIGLCIERTEHMITGMLGIMKSGAAYVPLDPNYPSDRVAFMLEDSRAPIVVSQTSVAAELPDTGAQIICLDTFAWGDANAPAENPDVAVQPADLAYVIYTSGSTGRPKGVAIAHSNTVALMQWAGNVFTAAEFAGVLASTSMCFDLSVFEIFCTLGAGGRVVLVDDALALPELPADAGVTLINTVPSAIAELLRLDGVPPSVKTVNLAGEPLTTLLADAIYATGTVENVNDLYGPSEDTTYSTWTRREPGEAPTIGRPIHNTQAYLLDAWGNPVPLGAVGELYLGGRGVAQGYLHRPELTAEKFVADKFGNNPTARLYRTGDQARYRNDGKLVFLGRIDQQVKLRGFRIELGEIEAALDADAAVDKSLVMVREDTRGDKKLIAYVSSSAAERPDAKRLRAGLQAALPEYMVPAAFVVLEQFPLLPNGKINRKALPAPEWTSDEEYVAPRTATEQALAEIWANLLQLERVGIHDNFFELGGDSILSIRIISRAAQHGISLTTKQVFSHQTIAALAAVANTEKVVGAEQGRVTGDVLLSPIQQWFLDFESPDIDHFNQSMMLALDEAVTPEILQHALAAVYRHHDALRLAFTRAGDGWKQTLDSGEQPPVLEQTDLSQADEDNYSASLLQGANSTQSGVDIASGCLLAARYFRTRKEKPNLALLVIHHLGVDGISWGILLEDIETACRALLNADPVVLPPKTTSFKAWTEKLHRHARDGNLDSERDYWNSIGAVKTRLPVDHPEGINSTASTRMELLGLDKALTRQLLVDASPAYQTRINDLLLTALGRALRAWTGNGDLLIDLESHGREELFDDVDISRTVGWFTSKYPVRLALGTTESISQNIKAVKEQLRSIPNNGIGFGLLVQSGRLKAVEPEIVFNYLGQFDQTYARSQLLMPSGEPAGNPLGPDRLRPHALDINSSVDQGELRISISYSTDIFEAASVAAFADNFRAELVRVIEHCVSPDAFGRSPSDYPLCRLEQSDVDRLTGHDRNVIDIYPATAMQHGMLFHSIYEANRDAYLSQVIWTLEGRIVPDAFEQAWQLIVDRHVALRTGIAVTRAGDPVQVAFDKVRIRLNYEDWSNLGDSQRERNKAEFLEKDRNQRFIMERPPLIRLNLFRFTEDSYQFVWTYHHIVLDGWSLPVVISELMEAYLAFAGGQKPRLGEAQTYDRYIKWLCAQEYADAEQFWRSSLLGLTAPTELPAAKLSYNPGLGQGNYADSDFRLPEQVTEQLKDFARQHRLTVNTLLQGVWSILLSRYSSDEHIIFGATTSGRPAELENVDKMVGLLINALPITTHVKADETAVAWLASLQEQQLTARQYEYASLVEVQGWSDVPRGIPLFNTLLVFENYPKVNALWSRSKESVVIAAVEPIEWTNYPLTVIASLSNELYLRLDYDCQYYDPAVVEQIGRHFLAILEGIVANPECRVGSIPMLTETEAQKLLVEWNNTQFDYPKNLTINALFEAQARAKPDAHALWCDGAEMQYAELDRRANRLARHLQSLGVTRGSLIGISIERNAHMIAGLLGTLKAGAAYVPLDPKYPPDRVAFMLEDSQASVLLTQESLVAGLPEHSATVVCLDSFDWGEPTDQDSSPDTGLCPDDLAYVIYTSGSTGVPKGVAIEHRNAVALIQWAGDVFEPAQFAGVLASTSICFDLSVFEIFCTLGIGGRIVLVQDALALPDLPESANVTLINTVPSAIAELLRIDGVPASVKTVNLAGEPLTTALADAIYELGTVEDVNDLYGPSEDTTYSTWTRREKGAPPTIGRPIHNTQVYLLDPEGQPVPVGVPGELFLGGAGVSRGYLNRPELTAEKYVPNPFSTDPNDRLYRTGDRARYRPDSNIEFLGRLDHQVKLRGFRIELGEIETRIEEHDAVDKALVIVREDNPGDQRLVAYLQASTDNLDRAQVEKWESEQVSQWEDLWQSTYSDNKDVELGSDFSGWISSYTGEPIPVDEMRVWIDSTAERIRELNARRVLEIGSGTGLVAARVAPHCEHYLATDFSGAVIDTLRKLKESRADLASLELRQNRADELTDIPAGSYDAIIINSVAQYFPDQDYFIAIVRRAMDMLRDGGHLFLGDLRSLPLLAAYHSSVQLFKANDSLTVANLASRIRQRIDEEEELLIDPAIFAALKAENSRISNISFQLKRGDALNELTRFRYDVIIEVGAAPDSTCVPELIHWEKAGLTLEQLAKRFGGSSDCLLIRGIPNARLADDAYAMTRLAHAGDMRVQDLRGEIAGANLAGIEPESIYELARRNNWDVQMLATEAGSFDVLCQPRGTAKKLDGLLLPAGREDSIQNYTNDPLKGRLARSLEPILRAKIKADLPEYMMPSAFIVLDEFPLTPNGKIDRKKLPAPEWRPQKDYVAPRSDVEENLAEIWSAVLRIERIGIHDDFFALGGHSLLAMQLISRVRDKLDTKLAMIDLFNHPTIAGLADQISGGVPEAATPIPTVSREAPLPLSFAQQRLWFLDEMSPGTATYNMPLAFKLRGAIDKAAMQRALDSLVARHESLRTTFANSDDEPVQIVHRNLTLALEYIDMQGTSEQQIREKLTLLTHEAFNLKSGPLFRLILIATAQDEHILMLSMHHIISDAWSQELLYKDLVRFYEGEKSGKPLELPELRIQYADYASWQRDLLQGEELDRQLTYWQQQLDAAPPVINLPLDKPRPPVETHNGAHCVIFLDAELSDQLSRLSKSSSCTLFVLFLTAFELLLYRYSGEDDIVIGTPISGRQFSELENIVGFFLNTLAIRCDLSGSPTFAELLQRTKQTTLEAFAHQEIPFEKLVEELQPERNLSHAPIFQVLFVFHQLANVDAPLSEVTISNVEYDYNVAKFDLQLTVNETRDGFVLGFQYNTDLFCESTVKRMLGHLQTALEHIAAEPATPIDAIALLDRQEKARVLRQFNATDTDLPAVSVAALVEQQVAKTPDTAAIQFGARSLTYGELNARANRLAHHLASQNIGPGTLVAVSLKRSAEAPVVILGIVKAGAAYVPVDPDYPEERVRYMLGDCGAALLITDSSLLAAYEDNAVSTLCIDKFDWQSGESGDPAITRHPDNPVYAIYTSGSTGQPKGVLLPDRALTNLLQWQLAQPTLGKPARTLQFASYSFDVSFQEIFSTWGQGGTLVGIDEQLRRDLPALARFIATEGIERLFMPYAALQPLAECIGADSGIDSIAVRDIVVAGEQLQITPAIRTLFTRLGAARLHNHYGPSETHVVTACTLDDDVSRWDTLPSIGSPIANTRVYVLDNRLQPQPIGVPGELHIGGVQVALGYLGREQLTREKFIDDPFSNVAGAKLYKTGDRARFNEDGSLQFLGRADDQLKWRGFRIEPGEIEATLIAHESIRQAAVVLRETPAGDKQLVAYLMPEPGKDIDENLARETVKHKLPDHMMPSAFVILDSIPLTPSGKIDRRKLPQPSSTRHDQGGGKLPAGPAEAALANIWQKLLGLDQVYVDDNFFDLGGHSLLTIKLIQEIEKATGERLTIADVFENPTINECAKLLEHTTWSEPAEIRTSLLQKIMDKFTLWFTRP